MKIIVFLIDGRTLEYEIDVAGRVAMDAFQDQVSKIIHNGYIHDDGKEFEYCPPHRILKVKSQGARN